MPLDTHGQATDLCPAQTQQVLGMSPSQDHQKDLSQVELLDLPRRIPRQLVKIESRHVRMIVRIGSAQVFKTREINVPDTSSPSTGWQTKCPLIPSTTTDDSTKGEPVDSKRNPVSSSPGGSSQSPTQDQFFGAFVM